MAFFFKEKMMFPLILLKIVEGSVNTNRGAARDCPFVGHWPPPVERKMNTRRATKGEKNFISCVVHFYSERKLNAKLVLLSHLSSETWRKQVITCFVSFIFWLFTVR